MKYIIAKQRLHAAIGMILAVGLYGLTFWLALTPRRLPATRVDIQDFQTVFVLAYIALIGSAFLLSRRFPGLTKGFLVGSLLALVVQGILFATSILMNV